jgi:hypothetical protein
MGVFCDPTIRVTGQRQAGLSQPPKYVHRNNKGEHQQNSDHPCFPNSDFS